MNPSMRKQLHANWQTWGILAAAVGLGATVAVKDVRGDLNDVTNVVTDLVSDFAEMQRKLDRIECIVVADAKELDSRRECSL